MCDFLLLLGVSLHLVNLVFALGSNVSGVVTTVVDKLLLGGQVHDVGTDSVHKVGRVRGQNQDVVVSGKVRFEPDDSTQIQVGRRFVQQQDVRLNEQSTGKSDPHSPTTRHVLGRLGHHLLRETETVQDCTGLGLERRRVHFLELLIDGVESKLVNVVGGRHVLCKLLEPLDLLSSGGNNVIEGIDIGRVDGA